MKEFYQMLCEINPIITAIGFLITIAGFAYTIYGVWKLNKRLWRKKRLPILHKQLDKYSDELDSHFRSPIDYNSLFLKIDESTYLLDSIEKHSTGILKKKTIEIIIEIATLKKQYKSKTDLAKEDKYFWQIKAKIMNLGTGIKEQIAEDKISD